MHDDHELIQKIYDAAMDPAAFSDVLQQIADQTGVYGAMVFDCTQHGKERRVGLQFLSSVYEPEQILQYASENNANEVTDQDRFADLSSSGNEINLIHDERLYSDAYQRRTNVEAMRRRGVGGRYGALLSKEVWNMDRFAFQTLVGAPLPTAEKLAWAERILAHLAKSITIGRSLSQQQTLGIAMTQYLDKLPIGFGILDRSGKLVFSNQEFERISQDNEQVSVTRDGHLTFNAAAQSAELSALLHGEDAHGRFGARPRREALYVASDEDMGLFIEICPISEHPEFDRFGSGTRLISIFDGAASHQIDPETVTRFFPLSKSEVSVLGMVSEGYSNTQIAEMRTRSVETVNSQLKSLLRKTAARNRTELVRVAMGVSMFSGK